MGCCHELYFKREIVDESFDGAVLDGAGDGGSTAGVAEEVLTQFGG